MAGSTSNPFTPPKTLDEPSKAETELQGGLVERDGDLLLIYNNAALPCFCMATGKPTRSSVDVVLTWHSPWLYLLLLPGILPYLLLAGFFQRRATLRLPVSRKLLLQHHAVVARGWQMMAAGLVIFMVMAVLESATVYRTVGAMLGIPVVVGVVGFVLASRQALPVRLVRVGQDLIVLSGVHPKFLEQVPQVGEDSFSL